VALAHLCRATAIIHSHKASCGKSVGKFQHEADEWGAPRNVILACSAMTVLRFAFGVKCHRSNSRNMRLGILSGGATAFVMDFCEATRRADRQ
jgi:hypothetical protein